MGLLKVLKPTFVVVSCVFTSILILVLIVSFVATNLFEADWARDASRQLGDRLRLWKETDSESRHPVGARHLLDRDAARPVASFESPGSPETRLRELVDNVGVGSREPTVWRELRLPVFDLIDGIMEGGREPWTSLEDGDELIERLPKIQERLAELRDGARSSGLQMFKNLSDYDLASLIAGLASDPEPLGDEESVSLLHQLGAGRSSGVLKELLQLDESLAAKLSKRILRRELSLAK